MPTIDFDPKHKVQQLGNFPRLKLELNERARILAGLEPATYAYVHELRAPKIVNGRPVMVEKQRKDKTTYEDYDYDFIGRPLCLGDIGILADKGIDPKNCPMCKQAKDGEQVDPPRRRFAMHVIKYNVKPNSFDLTVPFSCQLVVWAFTEQTYNKLTDIREEWGDLSKHDLKLGPCENKNWQRFEINVANTAAWMGDDNIKNAIFTTYRENKIADLESFCGRKVEKKWVEIDLDSIAERWRVALGAPAREEDRPSLSDGLDSLMSDLGSTPDTGSDAKPSTPAAAIGADLSDLFNEPDPAPAKPAKKAEPEAFDFNSVLSGIE